MDRIITKKLYLVARTRKNKLRLSKYLKCRQECEFYLNANMPSNEIYKYEVVILDESLKPVGKKSFEEDSIRWNL
jgi:hypothetical protein